MKEINSQFDTKAGFTYKLTTREGAVALFTKNLTTNPEGPKWFDVVKLVQDEEAGIEVLPAESSRGFTLFTFPETEVDKAEAQFVAFVDEAKADEESEGDSFLTGSTPTGVTILGLTDDQLGKMDFVGTPDLHAQNDTPAPTAVAAPAAPVKVKKAPKAPKDPNAPKLARGRKRMDVDLTIPDSGTFTAKDLAAKSGQSVPFVHNRLKVMVARGEIKETDRVQGKRGKPVIIFSKA